MLRKAIKDQGPKFSLEDMFKRFDFNGDGCFNQTEFESAFTVLEIPFKTASLRRLIQLSDKNRDGKISFTEFHTMLYDQDLADDAEQGFNMLSDSD